MRIFALLSLLLFFLTSTHLYAEDVSLSTDDALMLSAEYYEGAIKSAGVLMLHQCNSDRTMYKELGKKLSETGMHALALDFRLYGQSSTNELSINKFREKESDPKKRQELLEPHFSKWDDDILLAYDYLRKRMNSNEPIGVIGASCGGWNAISVAENRDVKSLVFLSSPMDEKSIDRYFNLENLSAMVIASQNDTYSYSPAIKIFENSKNNKNQIKLYKGKMHGYPLFKHDKYLANSIVDWFESSLSINK